MADDAGYPVTRWYPIGLVVLGLLAVTAFALVPARPSRPAAAAVTLLAAYAVWSYLSIAWADQQADAWDGANRTALYAAVMALLVLWPPVRAHVPWLVGSIGLGIAAIGAAELLQLGGGGELRAEFIGGRLSEPSGYPNANAALWTMGAFTCLALAAARRLPPVVRGALLGAAVLLVGMALFGQSRGWLFAMPLAVVACLALAPDPLRALAALGFVAVGAMLVRGPALNVHDVAYLPGDALAGAAADAARSIALVALALGAVAAAVALADRRRHWPWARRGKRFGLMVVGAAAALALAGAGAWAVTSGNPGKRISDGWKDFKGGQEEDTGAARFTSGLGSNRYDFWRVAWNSFERRPLTGVGADNFRQDYLAARKSSEQPRFPHSLQFRVLSQTGLVGLLLLAGALVAALLAVLRALRDPSRLVATAAGAAAAGFGWFLIHGSVDWFWEFAGLGTIAFALLGLAVACAPEPIREEDDAARRAAQLARDMGLPPPPAPVDRAARVAAFAGPAVALILAASFAFPWLAEREVRDASKGWRSDAPAAYASLDRAASLNPLSSRPAIVEGTVAIQREEYARARKAFEAALEREPRNAFATLELGLVQSRVGQAAAARATLARAARLDPRDRITRTVLRLAREGKRLDPKAVNASIAARARGRLR